MRTEPQITPSQFCMWRTLFAIAHADNILAAGEIEYMAKILEEVQFSPEQTETLKDDITNPKDIDKMFAGISDVEDRIQFFDLARHLVWADGDFGQEEQSAMIKLTREHFLKTDVDEMDRKIRLELEEDNEGAGKGEEYHYHSREQRFRKTLFSFRNRFLDSITGKYS